MSTRPPHLAQRLLKSFLRDDLYEEVLGDLDEKFLAVAPLGAFRAKVRYWYEVFHYIRPFALKKTRSLHINPYPMWRSYFKIGWRNLLKNRTTSLINIFGLSVGLISCLLIALYVQHEASFDTFQPNASRIVRVIMEYGFNGSPDTQRGNFTSTKVAPVFARTFPEVEYSIRMNEADMIVQHNGNSFKEAHFLFADSSFFNIFDYHLLQGNPKEALNGPRKLLLTASAAKRYFGYESPLNKILIVGSREIPYEVTGVIADYPTNSQIRFDFLASFSSLGANQEETYFEANYTTYLLLRRSDQFGALQEKITSFMKKEMVGSGATINFLLEPFAQIHLHSPYPGFVPNTNITYLYILVAVALLILAIVCFTYINLSTARSMERAREVGIRKVVGAARPQLFAQFIGESFLLFLISVFISIAGAWAAIPFFNDLTGQHFQAQDLHTPFFLLFTIVLILVVSLLAGSFPAMILSGFQPARVLKGIFKNTASAKWLQQSLMVFQFTISVFLIAATLTIQNQLHYIQHKNLGYDRAHVLSLPLNSKVNKQLPLLKQLFKSNTDVIQVSGCVSSPVSIGGGYNMRTPTMSKDAQISVIATPVDEGYVGATGLQLIAGSDLTEQDMKDVADDNPKRVYHFILNESAVRQLGWSVPDAVGKTLDMGERIGFVKGVVKDFHFQSLREAIRPVVLFTENQGYGQILVKISGHNMPAAISFIQKTWKNLLPSVPFEYQFLDDHYLQMYQAEMQLGVVMSLFSAIAILLACLGLLGLSAYSMQQRTKEIGIRKIMGASSWRIVQLLSNQFIRLVALSILIGCPLAYWIMERWLSGFAYRVGVSGWVFATAATACLTVTLFTVGVQGMRAAVSNPVDSLKAE